MSAAGQSENPRVSRLVARAYREETLTSPGNLILTMFIPASDAVATSIALRRDSYDAATAVDLLVRVRSELAPGASVNPIIYQITWSKVDEVFNATKIPMGGSRVVLEVIMASGSADQAITAVMQAEG